ncbi:MAG: ATP-binding protein [Micropruina sp.]|nr:ATP-binding protein [Micropruina sp.]
MTSYRPRVVDAELQDLMGFMGAVLIDGPKAVGKTATASQLARTIFRMEVDRAARAALETYPDQLFASPTPILFDEWQDTPDIWNLVRRAVDDHSDKGLYLLTGSSRPRDNARLHSGAGRIARLRMRPMSLFESGHSTGAVSLAAILDGAEPSGAPAPLSIPDLIERIVVGGWPETIDLPERAARAWVAAYNRNVVEVDVPALGPRRNPGNLTRLLASLGRGVGTPLRRSAVTIEVGGQNGPIDDKTLTNYLDALDRLMLTEPLPAWQPHMRSRTRLRTTPVHHFVDPSIGIAALGVGTAELLADLEAAGFHFESLGLRDLRVYSQALGATLSCWRDTQLNQEIDAILELPNGRWAGFEFKLGEAQADAAAESLLHMASKVDKARHGEPAALVVVTGGRFAYRRPDGILVVPITSLGP